MTARAFNLVAIAAMLAAPVVSSSRAAASQQAPPVQAPPKPQPFPQPGQQSTSPPATPVPAAPTSTVRPSGPTTPSGPTLPMGGSQASAPASSDVRPTDAVLGVAPYPASDYLESYDAGMGQRYYLFGTNTPYLDIVAYYKGVLKNGGQQIFDAPAMYRFDLPGKFQELTMAYPPSVVIEDYTWNGALGYLHVIGTKETRYKTIIQVVPALSR